MSDGVALLTYMWHYLVARLLYDELLRPVVGSSWAAALGLIVAAVVLVVMLRRRPRRTR